MRLQESLVAQSCGLVCYNFWYPGWFPCTAGGVFGLANVSANSKSRSAVSAKLPSCKDGACVGMLVQFYDSAYAETCGDETKTKRMLREHLVDFFICTFHSKTCGAMAVVISITHQSMTIVVSFSSRCVGAWILPPFT